MGFNPNEWWIGTGATHYLCFDKMFSTFKPIERGKGVHGELFHFKNQKLRKSGLEDDIWEGIEYDQCFICT